MKCPRCGATLKTTLDRQLHTDRYGHCRLQPYNSRRQWQQAEPYDYHGRQGQRPKPETVEAEES